MKAPTTIARDQAAEWATWFRAIGDPTRILILHLLSTERSPLTVGEITDRLDVGQSTVSHHLATLAEVGFVLVERTGTTSHWRVNEACIDAFPSAAEVVLGRVPSDFDRARSCP
ncbi:MAG: ArsR/SmtB family transcription factor [Acidimicrobiales bacterium]